MSVRKNILSLDGGGVRGKFIARFLRNMDSELVRDTGKGVRETFNVIIGTSIGSLIGSLIAYTDLSMVEIDELFNEKLSEEIMSKDAYNKIPGMSYFSFLFDSKYDGVGKRNVIDRYLPDILVKDTEIDFTATSFDVQNKAYKFFKSWEDSGVSIRDIIDGATSAQGYFPPVKIDKHIISDGVITSMNNPSMCSYIDTLSRYGKDADIRVVSVGTGVDKSRKNSKYTTWSQIEWMIKGPLINLLLEIPETVVNYQMTSLTKLLGHKYIRVEPELDIFLFDSCTKEYTNYLENVANTYWENNSEEVLKTLC